MNRFEFKFGLLSLFLHILGLVVVLFFLDQYKPEKSRTSMLEIDIITYDEVSNKTDESVYIKNNLKGNTNQKKGSAINDNGQNKKVFTENFFVEQKDNANLNTPRDSSKYYFKKNKAVTPDQLLKNNSKNNLQIRSSGAIYKIGTKDNPHPKYPILARKRGWQGRAVLEVSVDKFGNVSDLSVFKSTGHEILDNVSIDTLKEWKFKPATNNGLPVGDKLKIPIKFILLN